MLVPILAALVGILLASSADAALQRPFKETFGSAAQPSFEWPSALAVDQKTGDVLIGDAGSPGDYTGIISRFHADGTPAPFAALGSNVIDGKEANGKPCAEEPASCDKTPQNEVEVLQESAGTQIAIDESGGLTDGDIYVTQGPADLVDIFASDGRYLGQLTGAGQAEFKEIGRPGGVAVDPTGAVYVSNTGINGELQRYVPTSNPVDNDDHVESFKPLTGGSSIGELALGTGSSAGLIFGMSQSEGFGFVYEFDKQTGALKYKFGAREEPESTVGQTAPIAINPTTGNVLIGAGQEKQVYEFEVRGAAKPEKVARIITANSHYAIAFNDSDEVLLSEGPFAGQISVFGAPGVVPAVTSGPANNVSGTKANFSGTVNPTGLKVTECFFEYGELMNSLNNQVPCNILPPTDSRAHTVQASIADLEPNGHEYFFRLVAVNANGREESATRSFVTAHTVVTQAAAPVGTVSATLNGTVRPEGSEYNECFFEYGLSSSARYEATAPCEPGPSTIGSDFLPHAVTAPLTGLQASETYRYRLVAKNALGTLRGEELTFGTNGVPRVAEVLARDADEDSVTLEATINPSGFGTSYHFEWGPTTAYGNNVPGEFDPFVGAGTEPVLVKAKVSGLSAGSIYHYRVVATNSEGTTDSPDQEMETLNACGLPDGRCFELASPRDAGPIGIPGKPNFTYEMLAQAGSQPGTIAYVVESGLPGATKGAEVLYRGLRGPTGWSSSQISPPILTRDESLGFQSETARTLGLTPDDSCGVVESSQPLTGDASMRALAEAGGKNLYRINPDGTYTGITLPTPTNFDAENFDPEGEEGYYYNLAGMSRDCSHVVFGSVYAFPGSAGPPLGDRERLYEWDEGVLRTVGVVPGPSGETVVAAAPGGRTNQGFNTPANSVSGNGSRVIFSAERQISPNPEEIGKTGVFIRENGTITRDVSQSETATPDEGASYQYATPDGSRVFFTANAGLTARSSSEGTDLYEYNLATEKLTDLSVEKAEGGAGVIGVLGASEDGAHVYFAATSQLIPGRGSTRTANLQNGTASIYSEQGESLRFVGSIVGGSTNPALVQTFGEWTSRVSPDGRYLLFESKSKVTGYNSEGAREAYLFDAEAGSDATVCISCRRDGLPPIARKNDKFGAIPPLASPGTMNFRSPYGVPRNLVIKNGRPEAFFMIADPLAPGTSEGLFSVYEWSHGQVFRVVSEPAGLHSTEAHEPFVGFLGANEGGSDLYLQTPEPLTWEDGDQRSSVYDARVGGGFPQPPPPAAPCSPLTEGSCAGGGSPQPATVPGAASKDFAGGGNPTPKQQPKKKPKKHKKHKAKKKSNHKKGKKQKGKGGKGKGGKKGRNANGNRRAGK